MSLPLHQERNVLTSGLFGVVAPRLGWVPPLRYLLRRARVLRLLKEMHSKHMVEVGCGAGALLHEVAPRQQSAFGLETSIRARGIAEAIAREDGGRQCIVASPGEDWADSRDLVCSFDVLEHIEDDAAALRTWAGWLKPGGLLCLSVPAHRHRWGAGDEWAGHWRRYDRKDIEVLLDHSGFAVEYLECYGFPLANFTEWAGNRTYRRLLRERGDSHSKDLATADSGVDRDVYMKNFARIDSLPGRAALRGMLALQAVFARLDWGSGYLLLARKK